MASTPRIPKAEITGFYGWMLKRLSRRHLGEVPEAAGVMWHNRAVLFSSMGFGRKVEKWDQLDPNLKTFAHMAVASLVGCSWCLDFNYFQAHNEGLDEAKASEVPTRVTGGHSAQRLKKAGAPALVELTALVGFANSTTRGNTALGIESQGFSKACNLPLAQPSARSAASA